MLTVAITDAEGPVVLIDAPSTAWALAEFNRIARLDRDATPASIAALCGCTDPEQTIVIVARDLVTNEPAFTFSAEVLLGGTRG